MRYNFYDYVDFYKYAEDDDLNVDVEALKQEFKDKIKAGAKKSLKYGTIGLGVGYGLGVLKGYNGVRRGSKQEFKQFIKDVRAQEIAENLPRLDNKELKDIFFNSKVNAASVPGLEDLGDKAISKSEAYKALKARHAAKEGIKGLIPGVGLGLGIGDMYEKSRDDLRKARIILNSTRNKRQDDR